MPDQSSGRLFVGKQAGRPVSRWTPPGTYYSDCLMIVLFGDLTTARVATTTMLDAHTLCAGVLGEDALAVSYVHSSWRPVALDFVGFAPRKDMCLVPVSLDGIQNRQSALYP